MGQPIATKPLGNDEKTGLAKRMEITNLNINTDSERVRVDYRIVLLAPNGEVVTTIENGSYERYNQPEQVIPERTITGYFTADPADPEKEIYVNGTKVIPEQIIPANNKFQALRDSQVGQLITGMIGLDVSKYDGTPESLNQ